jgi:hypothetical protein
MLLSHKMLRPLVPLGMIAALLASAAAVVSVPDGGIGRLGPPWGAVGLGLQAAFYAAAAAGDRLPRLGGLGYLPRFLVIQNLASLRGLWRHLRGAQSVAWRRARRDTA